MPGDEKCPPSKHAIHWPNVVSMLAQRRRRWANIETTLCQCIVFARYNHDNLGIFCPRVSQYSSRIHCTILATTSRSFTNFIEITFPISTLSSPGFACTSHCTSQGHRAQCYNVSTKYSNRLLEKCSVTVFSKALCKKFFQWTWWSRTIIHVCHRRQQTVL